MKDPIVAEVHRIRQRYSAQFNYDLDAIFADLEIRYQKRLHEQLLKKPKISRRAIRKLSSS